VVDVSTRPATVLAIDGAPAGDVSALLAAAEQRGQAHQGALTVELLESTALCVACEDALLAVVRRREHPWLEADRALLEELAVVAFANRTSPGSPSPALLYQAAAEHLPNAAILMFDGSLRYVLAEGQALFASMGLNKTALLGQFVGASLKDPTPIQGLCRAVFSGEARSLRMTREQRTFSVTVAPVRGEGGQVSHGLLFALDDTERVKREHDADSRATRDALTSLLNRAGLYAVLHQRIERDQEPGTVLFVDVDGLKGVNDTQGHAIGDQVIVAAAEVLRGALREQDAIGRLGGDEFAAFVAGEPDLAALVSRLRQAATAHPVLAAHGAGISIGHARCEPGSDVDGCLEAADRAMYADKRARKQR
jgi:diguanylate cyclase (GGDEF)-like protein